MVRVKICCIESLGEAATGVAAGAHALGLVSAMPSGPGVIEEAAIAAIADNVPPGVSTFLLTSSTDPQAIVEQQRRCRCSVLQIVDAIDPDGYAFIRDRLPGVRIVQVIHVEDRSAVAEAVAIASRVDAVLLDSGRPRLGELGGTGRVHDWSTSRAVVEAVDKPVFLAGGLDASNVVAAVRAVAPYGVDVCSGVRTAGRLDAVKLSAFVAAVHATESSAAC